MTNNHWWYIVWQTTGDDGNLHVGSTEIATPWSRIETMQQLDGIREVIKRNGQFTNHIHITNWIYLRKEEGEWESPS